jgi:AraC-like DNA-binding protein
MSDESEHWSTGDRAKASRERRPEMRVASRVLPRFLAHHRDAGHDAVALCRQLGLPPDAASSPEVSVALETLRAATDQIALDLNDPFVGLRLARALPPTAFGLVELAARAAPTLGEGLQRYVRYSALLNDVESFELTVRGEEAELTHRVPGTRRALGRQCNELLLAWLVRLIRELTQQGWAPTEICLAHAAPTDAKPLQQHFEGTQLRFAMGFNALRFRASHLAQATSSGDPVMLAMVDEHADRILGSGQAEDVLHRIRTELRTELREGRPTLQTIAEKLGASPRTLQRRLDAHNTTFNDLLEEVRLALAKEFLANPRLGLKEVAYRVGYSDLTTFIRAFKRATGTTPLEYRNRIVPET